MPGIIIGQQQLLLLIILCVGLPSYAVEQDSTTIQAKEKERKVNFVPVPYINYNRTGGFEFGGVPMAMYKIDANDSISPPSLSGMVGKYSTKGNWVLLGFNRWFFKEDKWRVILAGGYGSNGFQFFLDYVEEGGGIVNYNTEAGFLYSEVQRKIYNSFYGGLMFAMANSRTSLTDFEPQKSTKFRALGLKFSSDTRDNKYYPYKGYISNLQLSTNPEFLGNDYKSNRLEFDYNHYIAMARKRDVLAARVKVGVGIGDVAFEQHFIVGGADIRGYTQGEYRGEQIYSVQTEYRWNLHHKISVMGFAGIATIAKSIEESNNGKILPGIGGGFRINVFPKQHMNVGMDAAVGLDDWGIYFQIGEAF